MPAASSSSVSDGQQLTRRPAGSVPASATGGCPASRSAARDSPTPARVDAAEKNAQPRTPQVGNGRPVRREQLAPASVARSRSHSLSTGPASSLPDRPAPYRTGQLSPGPASSLPDRPADYRTGQPATGPASRLPDRPAVLFAVHVPAGPDVDPRGVMRFRPRQTRRILVDQQKCGRGADPLEVTGTHF
jgi:hypothetical protein